MGLLDIFSIMTSRKDDATGTILTTTGDPANPLHPSTGSDAEIWGPPGYAARPSDPQNGEGTQAIGWIGRGRRMLLGFRDVASQTLFGELKPGETALTAPGPNRTGQGRIMLKDDGTESTVSIMTADGNAEGASSIVISVSSLGTISMVNGPATSGIQLAADGSITIMNQNGGISIDADGKTVISGPEIQIANQKVMLGLGATAANSAQWGPTGTASTGSTAVFIAP